MEHGRMRLLNRSSQEGAVAVTTAIILMVLVMMAAIVVDLGYLRITHRDSQSVADMAVTAAALKLTTADERIAACNEAWAYIVQNLTEVPDNEPQPSGNTCSDNFSGSCDPSISDVMEVDLLGGDIEVTIRMPVPDGAAVMQPSRQSLAPDGSDGAPCERISVEVVRNRDHILAGVGGFGTGASLAGAVARRVEIGESDRIVSLIVLDRTGCSTIRSSGGPSQIAVRNITVDGVEYPGTIGVDSAPPGTCATNDKVFDVDSGRIYAEGDIYSFGITKLGSTAQIYNDVPPDLEPAPQRGPILRRTSIDHRYNCEPGGYVSGPEPFRPESTALSGTYRQDGVAPCDTAGRPSYIKELYAFLADAMIDREDTDGDGLVDDVATDGQTPTQEFTAAGFRVYPAAGERCSDINIPSAASSGISLWYFNCPSGATVKSGSTLDLLDAEMVVFSNDVRISGTATIGDGGGGPTSDAVLAVWDGEVQVGGSLTTRQTLLYLNSVEKGRLTTTGTGAIDLQAPINNPDPSSDVDYCTTTANSWPSPPCFEDLTIWQNGEGVGPQDEMGLAGSGNLIVEGTIFVPNALINIGGGGFTDVRDAQFFGWQFWYHGGGVLEMFPNPERATPQELYGAGLIR